MSFYKRYRVSSKKSIGHKFNKLLIVEIVSKDKSGTFVKCICDCGNETIKRLSAIKAGRTTSCGCVASANARKQLSKANEHNPLMAKSKINDPQLLAARRVYERTYATNILDDLTFEQFLILSKQNCYYCDSEPSNICKPYAVKNSRYSKERQDNTFYVYNGLDRLDNQLGHTLNNLVSCCSVCNRAKHTRNKDEFLSWIKVVYDLHYR